MKIKKYGNIYKRINPEYRERDLPGEERGSYERAFEKPWEGADIPETESRRLLSDAFNISMELYATVYSNHLSIPERIISFGNSFFSSSSLFGPRTGYFSNASIRKVNHIANVLGMALSELIEATAKSEDLQRYLKSLGELPKGYSAQQLIAGQIAELLEKGRLGDAFDMIAIYTTEEQFNKWVKKNKKKLIEVAELITEVARIEF